MDRLQPSKIIKPESTLIEKTALDLACTFYEAARSSGLKSKYKNPKDYAKAYLKHFIPKAVDILLDMIAKDSTSKEMKDAIADALLERANDVDLVNTGIPVFENPLAASYVSDKVVKQAPLVINSKQNTNTIKKKKNRIEDLPLDTMLFEGNKYHG